MLRPLAASRLEVLPLAVAVGLGETIDPIMPAAQQAGRLFRGPGVVRVCH